ncbi:MAG: glutaredoxin domain-containing protein [Patescibacteria group bacterium]
MADVVIYTKSYCPFSMECKKFFKEKNIEFEEKEVVDDNPLGNEMIAKSGGRTDTPQVFINGHHIGSFDDVKALEAQGELDKMLNL